MLESNILKLAFCLELMVTCNTDSIVTRKHLTAQFVKNLKCVVQYQTLFKEEAHSPFRKCCPPRRPRHFLGLGLGLDDIIGCKYRLG